MDDNGFDRLTVNIPIGAKSNLRDIAKVLGYRVIHGTYAGQGSISALLGAIARGEVICVPKAAVDAARRD